MSYGPSLRGQRWKGRRPFRSVVYFVLAESAGRVKVGTADHFGKRFGALQAGSPVPLRALGTICGSEQVERWMHWRLFAHRSHCEWFNWNEHSRQFVDLVLSHGPNAAEFLCARELKADMLVDDGRPRPSAGLSAMPGANVYDEVIDCYRNNNEEEATPLGACRCDLCGDTST